jgi:S1-C subfamily serine protease
VIVTNAHVVNDADSISVALRDGTTYEAKLLGIDEINDLAVLKIPAKGLPVATLGNSGGPLVNAVGEVIGVNSSIYSPSGGSVGLGFAIPINRVKRVTEDLLLHGTIRRP